MNGDLLFKILGFTTATLVILAGIGILVGFLLPASLSENYRLLLGVIMIVYGIVRASTLWIKKRNVQPPNES